LDLPILGDLLLSQERLELLSSFLPELLLFICKVKTNGVTRYETGRYGGGIAL